MNSAVHEVKVSSIRSIDHQRITTAKSTTKRVLVSSSKNLQGEKIKDMANTVYFE